MGNAATQKKNMGNAATHPLSFVKVCFIMMYLFHLDKKTL